MSRDPIELGAPPSSVRVVPGAPDRAFGRIVDARLEAAFAEGARAGAAEALSHAAGALLAAAGRMEDVVERARDDVGRGAVELAVAIANHLLKAEVEAGRHDLEAIVREALAASGAGRANCTVHLNPKDLERLEGIAFRAGTEILGDIAVPVGDVHVTAPDGLLVRDLARAVESIGERILGDLR